jgi:hypothetical protein
MPVQTRLTADTISRDDDLPVSQPDTDGELPDKIWFPVTSYTREEFYDSTGNIRYIMKLRLFKSKQTADVNIGIEDLIEFFGDVECIIDRTDGVSIHNREHSSWTAKLSITDALLQEFDSRRFEGEIERLARQHGLALQKTTSLSGRGYTDVGKRVVTVNYTFGSYREDAAESITDPHTPTTRIEWVGGTIGSKDELSESTIEVTSVRTVTGIERAWRRIRNAVTRFTP